MTINGVHLVIGSKDPEADREFFRDMLGFPFVDAGDGWPIFRLPVTEAAFHPSEDANNGEAQNEVYLMCDDLKTEMKTLQDKGVKCGRVVNARWGMMTKIKLPSGNDIGLYQPRHPRP